MNYDVHPIDNDALTVETELFINMFRQTFINSSSATGWIC